MFSKRPGIGRGLCVRGVRKLDGEFTPVSLRIVFRKGSPQRTGRSEEIVTKEQERQIRILIQKLASESYSSSFMAGVAAGLKEVESILDRVNPATQWISCDSSMPSYAHVVFVSDGSDVGMAIYLPRHRMWRQVSHRMWRQVSGYNFRPRYWQSVVFTSVELIGPRNSEAGDAEKP